MRTRREQLTRQYAHHAKLETRRSIYRHRRPRLDLPGEVISRLRGVTGVVADVGCGPGAYVHRLRAERPELTVLGLDLSPGMVSVAGPPGAVADAAALPLPDASCGAVLALHMLYHVPDPAAAVTELARVRHPGGTVVIATNGAADKAELRTVCREAVAAETGTPAGFDEDKRFTLEYGEQLAAAHFGQVERVDFRGEVAVPDAGEVVDFVASGREFEAERIPFDAVLRRVTEVVAGTVAADGAFRWTSHLGLLICR